MKKLREYVFYRVYESTLKNTHNMDETVNNATYVVDIYDIVCVEALFFILKGILEDVGVIKLPKWLPRAKVGMTGVFVAVDRYLKGDYVNAAGEVMQALNPYGTFVDIAVAMYETDLMQRRLAESYAKEYKRLEYKLRGEKNPDKIEKLRNEMRYQLSEFKKCVDNLRIPY